MRGDVATRMDTEDARIRRPPESALSTMLIYEAGVFASPGSLAWRCIGLARTTKWRFKVGLKYRLEANAGPGGRPSMVSGIWALNKLGSWARWSGVGVGGWETRTVFC